MQLKKGRRGALTAAALSLIGASPARAELSADDWSFDFASLLYAEGDGRVHVFEPKLNAVADAGDGRKTTIGLTVDTLSGATPNGAAPYSKPQTFFTPHSTSSSSGGTTVTGSPGYTVPANELPTDPNFKDRRFALDLDYGAMPTHADHADVSGHLSRELDFSSVGLGTRWAHDINNGNPTLSAGVNVERDTLSPVGGAFAPLSQMPAVGSLTDGPYGSETKTVVDGLLGATVLLSPSSLAQVNYSVTRSTGYLNDPYKILSVVDSSGAPQYYVYEARPGRRLEQSVYAQYKLYIEGGDLIEGDNVMNVSVRFMKDDWGITSKTLDLSDRAYLKHDAHYFEPHVRLYQQSAASFYRVALDQGEETTIGHASADQRLGRFFAYTAGFTYGGKLSSRAGWSLGLDYYRQEGKPSGLPPIAGAALSQYDLTPALNAGWLLLGLTYK